MRPFKTRFRCAYTYRLKLAGQTKSLTHYTKGTPSGPHGTGSLSVSKEYLAFGGGPPIFRQDFTCPALLDMSSRRFLYGAVTLCRRPFQTVPVTSQRSAGPRSLAATDGVSLDFLSSGYLDVSVPRVCP